MQLAQRQLRWQGCDQNLRGDPRGTNVGVPAPQRAPVGECLPRRCTRCRDELGASSGDELIIYLLADLNRARAHHENPSRGVRESHQAPGDRRQEGGWTEFGR